MTDILKNRRSTAKLQTYSAKENNEAMSNQSVHFSFISYLQDSTIDEKIDVERYKEEYVNLGKSLEELLSAKKKESLSADKIKETLNRITVFVQEWNLLPTEAKKDIKRENILKKIVLMIDHENIKIRFRVIRTCLFVYKNIGFSNYLFDTTQSNQDDIMNTSYYKGDVSMIVPDEKEEDEFPENLDNILKKLAIVSKDSVNDMLFLEEGLIPLLLEILTAANQSEEELPYGLVGYVLMIIKNISGNEQIRKKMLETKNCMVFSNLLDLINQGSRQNKKKSAKYHKTLYQLTACLRNFAIDSNCTISYYETNIIRGICQAVSEFMQEADLIHNCIRILSKLSLNKECCIKILEDKECLENLLKIMKIHRNGLFLVVRVAFILANIATFLEEIREFLYYKLNAFPEITECFEFYLQKDKVPRAQDSERMMRMSFTKFDKTSANETHSDALVKIIRLMANLLTFEKIGVDFVTKNVDKYKFLIQNVAGLIKGKTIKSDTELLTSGLSFLANLIYYEKLSNVEEDFELKRLKTEILFIISRFIIQNENDEVLCEALRVLSNISRNKTLSKQIQKLKILEAIVALLNHSNRDIVYYCIGVIMNLMLTEEMKNTELQQAILANITNILFYTTIEEFDLVSCCLKCTTNIIDNINREKVDQENLKNLEELIINYGEQCDVLIANAKAEQYDEYVELRSVINNLLNIMPEENHTCSHQGCGRKFKSKSELQNHVERRHK